MLTENYQGMPSWGILAGADSTTEVSLEKSEKTFQVVYIWAMFGNVGHEINHI